MRIWQSAATVLSVSICAGLVVTSAQAVESCGGCETMKVVAEKIRTVSLADEKRVDELLDAATKTINSLPKGKRQLLSTAQIRELVGLFSQVTKIDKIHQVLEDTIEVIKANKTEFDKAVRQLPADDAKRVSLYVAVVLEGERGSDELGANKK